MIPAIVLSLSLLAYAPPPSSSSTAIKKPVEVPPLDPELKRVIAEAAADPASASADFVRLLDLGDETVRADGKVIGIYRTAYRLNSSRARQLAEVALPYNRGYDTLRVLKARTIRKDGRIVEVKPGEFRTQGVAGDALMYDDAEAIGFSMPAIEDGCIIDYTFEKITTPALLPGRFSIYWGFDGLAPVTLSRLRVTTPDNSPLRISMHNPTDFAPKITTDSVKKTTTRVWERNSIPRLDLEPMMPQPTEVSQHLEGSSIANWDEIAKWYWGLAKPQFAASKSITDNALQLTSGAKTDAEKASKLYEWICKSVRYVGIEFGLSAYRPHPVKEVQEKLYGDCKDKAALLISMLGEVGIKAYPALLKIEDRQPLDQRLPALSAFNHCIVYAEIEGKPVWMDPTSEVAPYGETPGSDQGCSSLVVKEGRAELKVIPIEALQETINESVSDVDLKADGSGSVKCEMVMRGDLAQKLRAITREIPADKRKEFGQSFVESMAGEAEVVSFSYSDANLLDREFRIHAVFNAPRIAQEANDLLLLPISLATGKSSTTSPFVKDMRKHPIVFRMPYGEKSILRYRIPDGFTVDSSPKDLVAATNGMTLSRKVTVSANQVEVLTEQRRPTGTASAAQYSQIREFFTSQLRENRVKVILKKR